MLDTKIFSEFPHQSKSLHELSLFLYNEQCKSWKMLAEGVSALHEIQFKKLHSKFYETTLQFNPKRIVSTGAKVDAKSIAERKCFLCVHHLPAEQKGILVDKKFLVLCNPMPIFKHHFTLASIEHIPQSIEEHILPFLHFAKELSPKFSVFYNGPKCGASAPDHMHFQASPMGMIPIENELAKTERKILAKTFGNVVCYSLDKLDRSVIVLEGRNEQELELAFLSVSAIIRKTMQTNDEPLMNAICSFIDGTWKVIMILRSKHRPDVYFKEGDEKILISPAAVDIGGLVVTPMEKDFLRVDAPLIENIFKEVSLTQEHVESIFKQL